MFGYRGRYRVIPALALMTVGALTPILGNASPTVETDWWAQVQRNIRESEYHVSWQETSRLPGLDGAWQSPNRAHDLRIYFTPEGIRIMPRTETEPSWEWSLSLLRYGRAGNWVEAEEATLHPLDNRIDYHRGSMVEWYVNTPEGLKQGFTLADSPRGGSGPLMLDIALGGDLAPRFSSDGRSIDLEGPGGGNVLHYADLRVTDASGMELASHMEPFIEGQVGGIRLVIDDRDASYPVTVDPLATAPARTLDGNQEQAFFGWSVATAGDVDGDGYDDIVIGAYGYDGGASDSGAAWVHHGSASGIEPTAAWSVTGSQDSEYVGYSVATAGDVNGDGYSDVIIGIPRHDGTKPLTNRSGRIEVYHGSATGLPGGPSRGINGIQDFAEFGSSVATAGDVNCDGYSDVIVGAEYYDNGQDSEGRAFVYHGSTSGIPGTPDWTAESNQAYARFGYAVASTGRVDPDNCDGVIVGAPYWDNGQDNEGKAYAYYGEAGTGLPSSPDWTVEGNQLTAYFGVSVATAGDVNSDGYADVIVGAHGFNDTANDDGKAFVYHGSLTGLSTSPQWTAVGEDIAHLGISVGFAGDVNGDGYADVIIGAREYEDVGTVGEGWALVYHGSPDGLDPDGSRPVGTVHNSDWKAEGEQTYARFGHSVSTAGDVNGDGFSDVVVGAYRYDDVYDDEGRVFVYHGSAAGISNEPSWGTQSSQAGASLGCAVASAGDVDGDGYGDVIVGAERYDDGQAEEGKIYVFHGSPSGLSTSHDWTAESNHADAWFGHSVASAGDVNGDGYGDVVVGAHRFDDDPHYDVGLAVVYHGSSTGLDADGNRSSGTLANADWSDSVGSSYDSDHFGQSVASAGDVNGDGYADVIIGADGYDYDSKGAAFVYHGSPLGLSASWDWNLWDRGGGYGRLGYSVASAGDVNGDGFSDIIVGEPMGNNFASEEGLTYVYHGSSTGLDTHGTRPYGTTDNADWIGESNDSYAHFGHSVASAGDIDGDGYSDVVVGAPYFGTPDRGRVYVYRGSPSGLYASPWWTRDGVQDLGQFGASVAAAGDLDGDGYGDMIVGVPMYDTGGVTDCGIVRVFGGGSTSVLLRASLYPDDEAESEQFGYSVASAGDVNGDGYADVIIGSRYYGAATNGGKAFVFQGGGGGGAAFRPRQRRSDNSVDIGPLGGADLEDRFRTAMWGRPVAGMGKIKLETEVKPLGQDFNGAGTYETSGWTNSGLNGVVLNQLVTGLAKDTPYHWRARLVFHPADSPFQRYGRWINLPPRGVNETDLRTPGCYDLDGDGYGSPGSMFCTNGGLPDCDDGDADIHPGAPALCDDKNNDCLDPEWPTLPPHDIDDDGDGMKDCEGDCNDADAGVYDGAEEICDGADNDCDGLLDNGCDGVCDDPGKWQPDVRVTDHVNASEAPSLAWNGDGYGVAWHDYRDGNHEVYFSRLDAAGEPVPGSEVNVTEYSNSDQYPSLVWTGGGYGIAWMRYTGSEWNIYFTRLDTAGNRLGDVICVSYYGSYSDAQRPSLVWNGEEYGLAWQDQWHNGELWEIWFARIDAAGSRIGYCIQVSDSEAANSVHPSLVWTGSEYGAVWRDKRDGNWELYFTRIDLETGPIGSNVRLTNDSAYSSEQDLVWTGSEYGVAWNDTRDGDWEVYLQKFDANGTLTGSALRVSAADTIDSWHPTLAWSGAEFGITWQDLRHGSDEVYFARVDSSGSWIESEIRVTSEAGASQQPDIAWNGDDFQVAWQDDRDGNSEIYAVPVRCCDDVDLDGVTECEDCDDNDGVNYPGNTEACDHQDNDCDMLVDEGFPVPGATSGLRSDPDKLFMHWDVEPVADRYDVVYGDLNILRSSGGFEASLVECLENGDTDTTLYHGAFPPPGEGYYYLVRAEASCKTGSYDTGGAGQSGSRDQGVENSGHNCF